MFVLAALPGSLPARATLAPSPEQILARVLEDDFDYNARLVVRRQIWREEPLLFSVVVSKGVGSKYTVVHPSTYQGQVFIDDGKQLRHYIPESKTIYLRPSGHSFAPSGSWLARRAGKNYTLAIVEREKRLGRDVTTIALRPKNAALPSRRMTVDNELPVVHLVDAFDGSDRLRLVEVIDLKPSSSNLGELKLDTTREVRTRQSWGPRPVKDMKLAAGILGFSPLSPRKIPLGFESYVRQLGGTEQSPAFVNRLSDGVAMVTVYQWAYDEEKRPELFSMKPLAFDSTGRIAVTADGDVPSSVLRQMAQAFAPPR